MQFRPLSAELFHVYNRTDRHDEANCRFSQLAAPNKQLFVSSSSHTHSIPITKLPNTAAPRPIAVAINQADGNREIKSSQFLSK
jgi:hypothetical protein